VQKAMFVELDIKAENCPNLSVKPTQPSVKFYLANKNLVLLE